VYTLDGFDMSALGESVVVSHLESAPDDVFGNVLKRLDIADLVRLEQVSKSLRERVGS
jgi:hypothetical protein